MMVYTLLKKRIENKTYTDVEEMQVMLDLYFFKHRINESQYNELTDMLQGVE